MDPAMTWNEHTPDAWPPVPPIVDVSRARGAYAHLRRAFERQVVWAREFSSLGDVESARRARLAADAICDELSFD
jgi:hypothetical protein